MMKKQALLNTYINNLDMKESIQLINQMITEKKESYVVPINVDVVVKIEHDPYLKKIVDDADMVLVDGQPLVWVSKMDKIPVKAKISGSDLVPLVCKMAANNGYGVYIIGGKPGVAEQASKQLRKEIPGIRVTGVYAPPLGFEKDEAEIEKINSLILTAHPELLIVCLGCPKQEKWVYENYKKCGAIVSICAGATVDFLAGNVKRAPKWISDFGLEWFFRFIQEPRRLFKRYFIEDAQIVHLVFKYWKSSRGGYIGNKRYLVTIYFQRVEGMPHRRAA